MSALHDINLRVQQDPAWAAAHVARFPAADAIAKKIHIVHVLGRPSSFWTSWPLLLEVTRQDPARPPSRTASAEDTFKLGRSLYFYVGRAYPKNGGIAFAFGPNTDNRKEHYTGSATPFDTGGLYASSSHAPHIFITPPDDLQHRMFTCIANMFVLDEWRLAFAHFLAAYFDSPLAYWKSRPCQSDPNGIVSDTKNSWQSWTFEVRLRLSVNVMDAEFWTAKDDYAEKFKRLAAKARAGERVAVLRFSHRKLNARPGEMNYRELVEQRVRAELGL